MSLFKATRISLFHSLSIHPFLRETLMTLQRTGPPVKIRHPSAKATADFGLQKLPTQKYPDHFSKMQYWHAYTEAAWLTCSELLPLILGWGTQALILRMGTACHLHGVQPAPTQSYRSSARFCVGTGVPVERSRLWKWSTCQETPRAWWLMYLV